MSEQVIIPWSVGKKMEEDRPGIFSYLIAHCLMVDPRRRIYVAPDVLDRAVNHWGEIDPPASPHPLLRGATPAVQVTPAAIFPVPRDKWPIKVVMMSKLRKEVDAGVGDTIARIIGPTTSAAWKAAFLNMTGHDCGCDSRRNRLNLLYPYLQNGGA